MWETCPERPNTVGVRETSLTLRTQSDLSELCEGFEWEPGAGLCWIVSGECRQLQGCWGGEPAPHHPTPPARQGSECRRKEPWRGNNASSETSFLVLRQAWASGGFLNLPSHCGRPREGRSMSRSLALVFSWSEATGPSRHKYPLGSIITMRSRHIKSPRHTAFGPRSLKLPSCRWNVLLSRCLVSSSLVGWKLKMAEPEMSIEKAPSPLLFREQTKITGDPGQRCDGRGLPGARLVLQGKRPPDTLPHLI